MDTILILLLLIGILAILYALNKLFKIPKFNAVNLINGAVKSGKTTAVVYFGTRTYKRNLRLAKFGNFIHRLKHEKEDALPLLISNIKLRCNYTPLTHDIITRQTNIPPKSVIIVSEMSLVAGANDYKDVVLDEQIMLWIKLFGHQSYGGTMFIDTQSIADLEVQVKKNLNGYLYIHHLVKWIPFFIIAYCYEGTYSYDNSSTMSFDEDTEDILKRIIIPKHTWRLFDCYCYSSLTDDKPMVNKVVNGKKHKNLKADKIVSFRNYCTQDILKFLDRGQKYEKKDN